MLPFAEYPEYVRSISIFDLEAGAVQRSTVREVGVVHGCDSPMPLRNQLRLGEHLDLWDIV